jgi:hypothetical protein
MLRAQMADSPDSKPRDEIAGLRRRLTQGADRGEPRAQERRRADGGEIVGNRHQAARPGDQSFGVSAVAMNAAEFLIAAVHEVAFTAILATAAGTPEEADAEAPPFGPALYVGDGLDLPDGFMARHTRPLDRKETLHHRDVRMAYAAGLDANPHLARARIANRLAHELKLSGRRGLQRLICGCAFHRFTPGNECRTSGAHSSTAPRSPRPEARPNARRVCRPRCGRHRRRSSSPNVRSRSSDHG